MYYIGHCLCWLVMTQLDGYTWDREVVYEWLPHFLKKSSVYPGRTSTTGNLSWKDIHSDLPLLYKVVLCTLKWVCALRIAPVCCDIALPYKVLCFLLCTFHHLETLCLSPGILELGRLQVYRNTILSRQVCTTKSFKLKIQAIIWTDIFFSN